MSCKPRSGAIKTYLDNIHRTTGCLRVLGSDEERQFEGSAMDQTKAVPCETTTPLNAWLLTSALSTSTLPCHSPSKADISTSRPAWNCRDCICLQWARQRQAWLWEPLPRQHCCCLTLSGHMMSVRVSSNLTRASLTCNFSPEVNHLVSAICHSGPAAEVPTNVQPGPIVAMLGQI